MKKVNFILFFMFIAFACEKDELCNSSIGTLIIENNLYVNISGIPTLTYITVHIYMFDESNQVWSLNENTYISGKYYVFQLKEGKYRIEAFWPSGINSHNDKIELFINGCEEITLSIPSFNVNKN